MPDDNSNPGSSKDRLECSIIHLRLDGIKDALSRSRLSFLTTTIISLMMILGTWNSYFSWDRDFGMLKGWVYQRARQIIMEDLAAHWPATGTQEDVVAYLNTKWKDGERGGFQEGPSDNEFKNARDQVIHLVQYVWPVSPGKDGVIKDVEEEARKRDDIIRHLQQKWVEQWVKNQQISVPLLGVTVSTSDATFLASVALVVAMIWFFWSTRRENHSISRLLREHQNAPEGIMRLVYHGIAANLMFVSLTNDDRAHKSLSGDDPPQTFPLMRHLLGALSYLPSFAILFCGAVQLIYVFVESPFRPDLPFMAHIVYIGIVSVVAVTAILITLVVGYRINCFGYGVTYLMREFWTKIEERNPDDGK
ncbi:hypothetical protein [Prosthecobacter sp.]